MASNRKTLSARDTELALSVVNPVKERKTGRRRRCVNCGLMYTQDELTQEFDDEERFIGFICEGCY